MRGVCRAKPASQRERPGWPPWQRPLSRVATQLGGIFVLLGSELPNARNSASVHAGVGEWGEMGAGEAGKASQGKMSQQLPCWSPGRDG